MKAPSRNHTNDPPQALHARDLHDPLIRQVRAALDARTGPSPAVLARIHDAARRRQTHNTYWRTRAPAWCAAAAAAAVLLLTLHWHALIPSTPPTADRRASDATNPYRLLSGLLALMQTERQPGAADDTLALPDAPDPRETLVEQLLFFQGFGDPEELMALPEPSPDPHATGIPAHNRPGFADPAHG